MRFESLSLRGILAFTEQVSFDFRELPPGLVAVVGPNGAGKTTLIESLLACLYRQFPSRQKEAFDYATRTDAFIEETFELEGRGLYRAHLALDGPHRKAEATLAQIQPDGRAVLLNDGKVSTYDAEILRLLPRFEDLLASVFAAQNRVGSFSGLDKKGRRELFASLLGFDHYEAWAGRARAAAARVQQEIDRLGAARDLLVRDAGQAVADGLDREAQRLQVDLGAVEIRRVELAALTANAEQALDALQAQFLAHADAVNRRDRLESDYLSAKSSLNTLRDGMVRAERVAADERGRLNAALSKALARLEAGARDTSTVERERREAVENRDAIVADAEKRIAANEGVLARAGEIRAAADAITALDAQIDENRAKQADVQKAVDAAVAEHGTLQTRRRPLAERQAEYRRALNDASLLVDVPCRGEGDYAACGFLSNAKKATQLVATLAGADADIETIDAEIASVEGRHAARKADLSTLVKAARALSDDRVRHQTIAADLPHLQEAEAKIATHRARITDARNQFVMALFAVGTRERERQVRIIHDRELRQMEHDEALRALDARTTEVSLALQAEETRLVEDMAKAVHARDIAQQEADATNYAAQQAAGAQSNLAGYRAEWDQTTSRLATVQAQVADLKRRAAIVSERRAELAATEARIEALRTDLVEWTVLAKAMGRDGLPTIEIDQAGPTVSAYANDLLQACFGGRFTIDLVTQAPKATKGKDGSTFKEVFEANIYDQQRAGEARAIEDLSGGERVIVEEVLRSAIALLVNQRNQFPIRTVWRDETTGALDPENAGRYIAMLRRLQQIGGFHQVLFVTHNEDCARLADAQIRVDAGTYTIALPPFVGETVLA